MASSLTVLVQGRFPISLRGVALGVRDARRGVSNVLVPRALRETPEEKKTVNERVKDLQEKGCRESVAPVQGEILDDEAVDKNRKHKIIEADSTTWADDSVKGYFDETLSELRSLKETIVDFEESVSARLAALPTTIEVVVIFSVILGAQLAFLKLIP